MSIFSIILISIYISLSLLPIIYNHVSTRENTATREGDGDKVYSEGYEKTFYNQALAGRGLIVFLNNLSDDQIKYILNQLKILNRTSNRSYVDVENSVRETYSI